MKPALIRKIVLDKKMQILFGIHIPIRMHEIMDIEEVFNESSGILKRTSKNIKGFSK
jgi:hypothetical protein